MMRIFESRVHAFAKLIAFVDFDRQMNNSNGITYVRQLYGVHNDLVIWNSV